MESKPIYSVTILTCKCETHKAVKEFRAQPDGSINKIDFGARTFFSVEEKEVSDLKDLSAVLDQLLDEPRKLIIRGKAKKLPSDKVRRKLHGEDAVFDACSRPYVMLDIDKLPCPQYFDATSNAEEVIKWVLEKLPEPFRKTSCYYKFSSSQNVPQIIEDKPTSTISVHLWFWCSQVVTDEEWKRYFKFNQVPVDLALFSAVQIHYTARPSFFGMEDPLPIRSGILTGDHEVLPLLEIPEPTVRKHNARSQQAPEVSQDNREKAINQFLPHYQEGTRNRFCGAVAGTLYRGGWSADDTAYFVYGLAEKAQDEEADARYSNALRICDAIDNNNPAQGIPTLKDEIGVENLSEILVLLGLGKPDLKNLINSLSDTSDSEEIREVMRSLTKLPEADQKLHLERIKKLTGQSKTTLNALLDEAKKAFDSAFAIDWTDLTMERLLTARFKGGLTLMRAVDGRYWRYNERYWEPINEDFIKSEILPHARQSVIESDGYISVSNTMNGVLNILSGRVYKDGNLLHSQEALAVINCLNGELWFDESGITTLKPHQSESYLKHCLDVEYDPRAACPIFDKALLNIFCGDEDMVRHFLEFAGYICQPWRKLALIVLLHGHGSNGKSSLMGVIQKVLGPKMIMSDRISKIEDNPFKIGGLDGKLLFLDDDVDEGTCLEDGFLKKISEEKLMTGQHKHKPLFQFMCRAVPVMLANNYPAIKDVSYGVQRRIFIIPFTRRFTKEEADTGLFERIWEQEASGILNRFIEGFQRVKRRGHFQEPDLCVAARSEWLRRGNILMTFIEEVCEINSRHNQPLGDFYTEFRNYCDQNGIKYKPARNTVQERLEKLGYPITELNGKNFVRGLRAKADSPFSKDKLDIDLSR